MSMPGDFGRAADVEMRDAHGPALDELVGRIGSLYTRRRLCPPFDIRRAAGHWLRSLTQDEITGVVEQHFERCELMPGVHASGSGDATFNMLRAAVNKAIDAKLAWGEPVGEAERPRRRHRGRVRKLHHAGGVDVFDDRRNPDWIRDVAQPRPAPPQTYNESGMSVGEDVDPE